MSTIRVHYYQKMDPRVSPRPDNNVQRKAARITTPKDETDAIFADMYLFRIHQEMYLTLAASTLLKTRPKIPNRVDRPTRRVQKCSIPGPPNVPLSLGPALDRLGESVRCGEAYQYGHLLASE